VKLPLAVAIAALLPLSLPAAELGGVTMPDQVTVEDKTLVLNGLGLREATFLRVDVYVAGLYLEKKSTDAEEILASEQAKRLSMRFVRNVGKEDQVKHWNEGFQKNAAKDLPALRDRIATLASWVVDVNPGDTIVVTYVPEKGVSVEIKGKLVGSIPGADFGRALFSLWLGPQPPNSGLKDGLLGRL
jgi:hypothetical protein